LSTLTGKIRFGINNIYTVSTGEGELECRIKGKILKGDVKEYNPLAPGDIVQVEPDLNNYGNGMIVRRLERQNLFSRWNKKRNSPQVIAANIDLVICVTSPVSPPFRPRFIDRVLVAAEHADIRSLILLNKSDQYVSPDIEERLAVYLSQGYPVMRCSALYDPDIESLRSEIMGKTSLFFGQSGVGKSSLLNRLNPDFNQKTGEISAKFNRGKHTTCYSILFQNEQTAYIDTPGIREIDMYGIDPGELHAFFPEFLPLIEECDYPGCSHIHEPGCAVIKALKNGQIHFDRYDSYTRIYQEICMIQKV
jgi:ribosome biogenesis GTPase / thiamine phosphate phosphatase